MANPLANIPTRDLENRLARYQDRSDPASFVEGDAIKAELNARRLRDRCEHGNRIGDFCCGCQQHAMG